MFFLYKGWVSELEKWQMLKDGLTTGQVKASVYIWVPGVVDWLSVGTGDWIWELSPRFFLHVLFLH